jgi:hypothetical protein
MHMPIEPIEKFADNWAYLKTELNWLDRLLMLAVARQRKETKEVDRIAQSRADRVTSHWWKGIISLEGGGSYDEHRKTSPIVSVTKPSYQHQLEERVRTTRHQGIVLGLPLLCDRLGLTVFEKNLVLMSLAPEVNRRYSRLYRYLQGEDPIKTDLPLIDLMLRLLCRNDQEWRDARNRLTATAPLLQHRLITLLPPNADTLLNQYPQLDNHLIDYLLSEKPTAQELEDQLQGSTAPVPTHLVSIRTAIAWSDLVLPASLLASLQHLVQRIDAQSQLKAWGFEQANQAAAARPESQILAEPLQGRIALLAGAAGTGKTMAAEAIAAELNMPLVSLDLATLSPKAYAETLEQLVHQRPNLLLLQSAHLWFGRASAIADAKLAQFLDRRRRFLGITILETRANHAIRPYWRQQLHPTLIFSLPNCSDRLRLWQKAFPAQVPLTLDLDWNRLAQVPLSGGEIRAIACEAAICFAISGESCLNLSHLATAFQQQGKLFKYLKT